MCYLCGLQLKLRRRLAYGTIVTTCVTMATYFTTLDALSTDIVGGACVPWGANASDALQKSMITIGFAASYVLPVLTMMFCYSRIVYALTHKVILTLGS